MDNELIDFIIQAVDWSEQTYETKAIQYRKTVPGYDIIYKDTKEKFARAYRELYGLKK